jgi:DNA polymerase III subunit beta
MDFQVKKGDLLKELQYVQGVVERKTTVPILSNLLLETTGSSVFITATDLDVTIRCCCPANVKVSGAVSVGARKLFDIVRLLPESDVHFKATSQEWVNITCERSRFKIASLSKENFPDVPEVQGEAVHVSPGALRHMISRCAFAITQEESRYTLNGALMILKPEEITFVTTDGHRLVVISRKMSIEKQDGETRVLVPKKTLLELAKLSSEDLLSLEFKNSENHLFFRLGERLLVSRVLTGQFPNYEMVIPRQNDKSVVVNTLDFTDALKRASVMADEQSHAVRISIRDGQVDIFSTSVEQGEARDSVTADYSGEDLEIGFNAQYLVDFLVGLESEQVVLEIRDSDTQGMLRPATPGDYTYQYVIMPMKI